MSEPCPHCGGSGLLIRLDPRDRRPRAMKRTIGKPYPCNFCGGTGRDKHPVAERPSRG